MVSQYTNIQIAHQILTSYSVFQAVILCQQNKAARLKLVAVWRSTFKSCMTNKKKQTNMHRHSVMSQRRCSMAPAASQPFIFSPFYIYSLVRMYSQNEYSGGLLSPDDNPIRMQGKKAGSDVLSLEDAAFPPSTGCIISHLIMASSCSSSGLWRPDMHMEIQLNAVSYVFV